MMTKTLKVLFSIPSRHKKNLNIIQPPAKSSFSEFVPVCAWSDDELIVIQFVNAVTEDFWQCLN